MINMRLLKFNVNGQNLSKSSICDFNGIQKGSKNYLKMAFLFSSDWIGCAIAATFWSYDKELCAVPIKNGMCKVPDEVTDKRRITISLSGKRGSYKITTNRLIINQEG